MTGIKRLGCGLMLLIFSHSLLGQSVNAPLDEDYYHWVDRFAIKSKELFPTEYKAYPRKQIAALLDSIDINDPRYSRIDRELYDYLAIDNYEWTHTEKADSKKPLFKVLYQKKPDLYHVDVKNFELHLNPVFHFGVGYDTERDLTTFINSRGVELRGTIGEKVGYYSYLVENQLSYPQYVQDFVDSLGVLPHEGFWKDFKDNGVDFFTARGYVSWDAAKVINFQFGHDRFKIGNGMRSVLMSDFANNYLFFKINTKVWRIQYTNLFTQVNADAFGAGNVSAVDDFPVKYMAMHRLGIDITDNLNIGLFEAVIYGAEDTVTNQGRFELGYLNPIIFYRAIEQQNGSKDNSIIGLDFKWNIRQRVQLYGQFLFDEFKLDEITAGNGWWANKFSGQFGAKYLDAFGIKNVDLQGEFNISRPYTYSHSNLFTNYSHYRQPLAHELGANFREFVGVIRAQPLKNLYATAKLIYATYGTDTLTSNYGKNILLNNRTRNNGTDNVDFNNEIGQGIGNTLLFLDLVVTYQIKHRVWFDLQITRRNLDNDLSGTQETWYVQTAFRMNIPRRIHDF